MPVFEFNERTIEGEVHGCKYIIRNVRPYGFYQISLAEGGRTPDECVGVFTTLESAIDSFTNYACRKREENADKPVKIRVAGKRPADQRYITLEELDEAQETKEEN